MVKRINFFATKNDMVSVLSEMEEQLPFGIKYIQCGKTDSILYSTVKDIPGLGTLREKHNEISYLIMRCDDEAVRNKFGQVYPGFYPFMKIKRR